MELLRRRDELHKTIRRRNGTPLHTVLMPSLKELVLSKMD